MLTATLDGLIVGTHTIFLNAGSGLGVASRTLTFEVVDSPPVIQVGISETDGNLVVSFDRPIPPYQLGDIARWNPQGFDSDKQNVTVLPGNMSVSIGMSYPLQIDDPKWFNNVDAIPYVEFESTLGTSKCPLWGEYDVEGLRQAQSMHCDKGQVTSDQCHSALGWTMDWSHLESNDGEERQSINIEDWPPSIVEPWSSCFTYNVVRHSAIGEGHLDYHLSANWQAQCDNVMHSGNGQYSGVGYFGWHREIYSRGLSYYPPSWCDWGWELTVDCNNCVSDPPDPPGYESKGFKIDEPMYLDYTPPEITVEIVCGNEIHNRVNQLISTLSGTGTVYTAGGLTGNNTQLYNYYWTYMGQYIQQWLQLNPDGLCLIMQAEDPQTIEGNYLLPFISMDYETQQGQKYCVDNLAQNFFYVDEDPLYNSERTTKKWPKVGPAGLFWDNNDLYLHTDGDKTGEHSVWITIMDCEYLEYKNLRFRATDEINNWARSDDLALETLSLNVQPEQNPVIDGESVTINAEITGPEYYEFLVNRVKWSVQVEENGDWVDYGPNEDINHQNWGEKIYSTISTNEDWIGPDFTIEEYHDCELRVRGRIDQCVNTIIDADCTLYWQSGGRGGQTTQSQCGGGEILLDIEPGKRIISLSPNGPWGQDNTEVYWLDGPSIPIYNWELAENTWHSESLENVEIYVDGGRELPVVENLLIGKIQIRVYVPVGSVYDFYELYMLDSTGNEVWSTLQDGPWEENCQNCVFKPGYVIVEPQHICDIDNLEQEPGYYTIRVEGRFDGQPRGMYAAEAELEVFLECVKPSDLLTIVRIYAGDGYYYGRENEPHHEQVDYLHGSHPNHNPNENGCRIGSIDCSGLICQLLRRLGREFPNNNDWNCQSYANSSRLTHIDWDELAPGDLIVWHTPTADIKWPHIVIFAGWSLKDVVNDIYVAEIWEARACEEENDHYNPYSIRQPPGVWFTTLTLRTKHEALKFNLGEGMFFNNCQ